MARDVDFDEFSAIIREWEIDQAYHRTLDVRHLKVEFVERDVNSIVHARKVRVVIENKKGACFIELKAGEFCEKIVFRISDASFMHHRNKTVLDIGKQRLILSEEGFFD